MFHCDRGDAFHHRIVTDALGHERIGDARIATRHNVEHAIQAFAADVADHFVFVFQLTELSRGDFAEALCAFRQLVPQYDFELLQRHRGDKGITGIGSRPWQAGVTTHFFRRSPAS